MADRKPRTGEATTVNYGWTKPNVGGSDDAWGGYLNADLDGIDGTVKGVSTVANAAYPASNPAGYVTAEAIPAPYVLPTASTTVLGGVKVDGATIKAAADGTISTTVVPMGDNRLINGDMRIDQRNGGASGTAASAWVVDRWNYAGGQAAKITWGRNLNAVAGPVGFPYYLGFQSSSAYTPLTGDYFQSAQPIEADMVSDFAWGTANAQPVTLSFWARSSLTGTFSGCIVNYPATRSYLFSYSLPTANTWTKITITIPGDTGGTWVMSGNAGGAMVIFDLGTGATYRGPANVWGTNAFNAVTGAVSVVATNAATFYLTGVKLEIGSVATPYNRQSMAKSTADCQRYFISYTGLNIGVNFNPTWGPYMSFPTPMRASPTATGSFTSGTFAATANPYGVSLSNSANSWGAAAGTTLIIMTAQFSAEL